MRDRWFASKAIIKASISDNGTAIKTETKQLGW